MMFILKGIISAINVILMMACIIYIMNEDQDDNLRRIDAILTLVLMLNTLLMWS